MLGLYQVLVKLQGQFTIMATSYMRLSARNQYTSSPLIGGKGRAGPSWLHTMLEGPTE